LTIIPGRNVQKDGCKERVLKPSTTESEGIRNVFLTLNWYEPIGQSPDFSEEKEVTFDNLQELVKFLKQNRWIAEKVGYR